MINSLIFSNKYILDLFIIYHYVAWLHKKNILSEYI